ncbi:MAG: galactose mutarotase [Lachnospiraceae bacterium]|nr:galactose mutarotase [Lachnospiraceae bacterium]
MKKTKFGITKNGELAGRYRLENKAGLVVEVSDFGALVLAIRVPDRFGEIRDVVLGFDSLEEYYDTRTGFGAYVGRNCNRIADARVVIEGVEYWLDANNGVHNIHSGNDRSHTKSYEAAVGEREEARFVEFTRTSPHMEQGFPGNLEQKIRYTLTENNEFIIDYVMVSDRTTVVNPTNHSYFNLSGHNRGNVLQHELEVYSDGFLLTSKSLIPTGEIATVEGTPMDFRRKKMVGEDINADYLPLQMAGGYDHNYVFANDGQLKKMAKLHSPESGISMEVYSDLCGLQLCSASFLKDIKGKNGAVYQGSAGLCLETQFYPNACKEPTFPSSILTAGKVFRSRTIYRFLTE